MPAKSSRLHYARCIMILPLDYAKVCCVYTFPWNSPVRISWTSAVMWREDLRHASVLSIVRDLVALNHLLEYLSSMNLWKRTFAIGLHDICPTFGKNPSWNRTYARAHLWFRRQITRSYKQGNGRSARKPPAILSASLWYVPDLAGTRTPH